MVVSFKNAKELNKVGNKAKFLVEMSNAKFNVPQGIIVDSDTYKEIIDDNNITKKINNLLSKLTKENTSEISNKINKLFDSITINSNILKEINSLIKTNKLYAVRSSGTKEDLDNYSFAGQYETFLNVSAYEVPTKIIDCYKSMFSETILSYLLNNNISFNDLGMTVIIQEMVPSELSGICFTLNPITGKDTEMLIEVGEGLGENIVSGKIAPEQYYYDWYHNTYNYDKKNKLISKKLLKEITKTFLDIKLHFGYPCDIEFAIAKDKLYILQSRQITKIKYQGIKDIWSTADFKDGGVSAKVCTPYMWSLYEYIWEFTLRKFILDSKILKPNDVNKKLGDMFYGRCYWNLSVVKHAMSKVVGYKEREFDSEYGIKINYEGDGATTKITPTSIINIIRMALAQSKILKTRNDNADNYKEDLLNKYFNYKNNYDKKDIKDIKKTWYHLTKRDYLQSEATYFWQIFINTIHQSLYKDGLLKYVNESDYLTLLSNIDNISHLLPFYEIWDISRDIRNNKEELDYWTNTDIKDIVSKIKRSKKTEYTKIKHLINEYGYHSDSELDVTYPCYYEDITPLIISIKDTCLLEDEYSPQTDKTKGNKKINKILNKIEKEHSKNYKKVKTKIDKMRRMLWWREEFRDISTRFYYIIRIYTIELSKQLVKEKVLNNINDIWFLRVTNLWDYLDKKITKKELSELIEKNKTYYNAYRNFMSENEIGSVFDGEEEQTLNNTNLIKGLGANNGTVIGTARVIESFAEIDRLQKNDILVTKFTDTGWTSKFAYLSGIVTEFGGILCHAAIVSREYGIPAIVSCHDAMSKIKDGDTIKIDGKTGIVTIIEEGK